ncbi:hypothetical protein APR50_18605 [Variovorax paradoxus]|jgi:hypothetical protein|uniref:hypothetical protein n=1 Tax=Variovorax paradoxus TaxID=34073 RepID=UPI0006E644CF|nr:hypothetical protein APR52_36685 [Variovorax paradoxus]KPV03610.1 hypothetical protein APR49_26025 [Variovorax paradoxus]KPV05633.1 hypothetical protein APR50_18605 [Variovorax paradoxus]KPV17372.1 hypothetical protein APR48_42040 [Variovorax paradoxus]KPV17629.1 hypothetical protein APR47_42370 [Variovorax paradoxus]
MADRTLIDPLTLTCLPEGARALLVSIDDETGQFKVRTIAEKGDSVLNIERDLLKHLNEYPHSTEWLEVLRDYCDGRLAARAEARRTGSFVTPKPMANWDMKAIVAAREARHG